MGTGYVYYALRQPRCFYHWMMMLARASLIEQRRFFPVPSPTAMASGCMSESSSDSSESSGSNEVDELLRTTPSEPGLSQEMLRQHESSMSAAPSKQASSGETLFFLPLARIEKNGGESSCGQHCMD